MRNSSSPKHQYTNLFPSASTSVCEIATRPTGILQRGPRRAAAGRGRESEREADALCKEKVGGGGESVKSWEMWPLNNQRPNQFVQRPRGAGGLQRNVLSGRSLGASKSISQTNTQQPVRLLERGERWPGGMGPSRGAHSHKHSFT